MEHLGPTLTELMATRINYCRMWLQVTRISDIAHPDRKTILPAALSGTRLSHRQSSLKWPRIPRPPDSFWKLWKQKLLSWLSCDGKSQKLCQPLGPWNHQRTTTDWQYLYEPTTKQLLSKNSTGKYHLHQLKNLPAQATYKFNPPQTHSVDPSPAAIPVLPKFYHGFHMSCARPSLIDLTDPAITHNTFRALVEAQNYTTRRLLHNYYDLDTDTEQVATHLSANCRIDIGTDGSVKHLSGAFAWVMQLEAKRLQGGRPAHSGTCAGTEGGRCVTTLNPPHPREQKCND